MVDDQVPCRAALDGFGELMRRHVRIEDDHGEARGLEEKDHHESGSDECFLAFPNEIGDRACEERYAREKERSSKISEGRECEVEHVTERERVVLRVMAEREGNVARSGHVTDSEPDCDGGESGAKRDCGERFGAA